MTGKESVPSSPFERRAWIDAWSAQYSTDYDDCLAGFKGKASFNQDDVVVVYAWKFRRMWAERKIVLLKSLPGNEISSLSERAFACEDELGALLILTLLPGAQTAGASALLMAQDPERYTVMDRRALKSLVALKLWDREAHGGQASPRSWLTYLAVCRKLASETGCSLRTVDRALWLANGQ